MANFDQTITVVGNLTAAPELRYTQSGKAVVNGSIASTPRVFDRQSNEFKDGEATFFPFTLWEKEAENFAASYTKGNRVIAVGRIKPDSYTDGDGVTHRGFKLEVDEIAASTKFATVAITRTGANASSAPQQQVPAQQPAQAAAPVQQAPVQQAPAQPVQQAPVQQAPVAVAEDVDFS